MKTKLRLGTRRSLLAVAQSSWVAKYIESKNPGLSVELVGIETKGDKILDIPLSKIEGKNFFVKEIDDALLSKDVDFSVSSMKDLSLERPDNITLAAIPKRENPRDIIVFTANVMDRIKNGHTLKIGTSSPRRLENIPSFLAQALPMVSPQASAQTYSQAYSQTNTHPSASVKTSYEEIRGNVNTRLSRLHEPTTSPRYLDGVVLALAGLIRLYRDKKAKEEIQKLTANLKWMVLPLQICPPAPAQGALSVECRRDDAETINILKKIHDKNTEEETTDERNVLKEYGGGCHQRFGASSVFLNGVGRTLIIRGKDSDGKDINQTRFSVPQKPKENVTAWDGTKLQAQITPIENAVIKNSKHTAIFIANSKAVLPNNTIDEKTLDSLAAKRIWASGIKSWYKLASFGIWVEGSADSFGFDFIRSTLKEPVLNLPDLNDWLILTHKDALKSWGNLNAVAAYELNKEPQKEAANKLKTANFIFWASGSQYDSYCIYANKNALHSCGVGKTLAHLKKCGGQNPKPFPSVKEWKEWLNLI